MYSLTQIIINNNEDLRQKVEQNEVITKEDIDKAK